MARMYSRKKGKSGSSKPLQEKKLAWIRYKKREVELLVVKLSKEGKSPSQIGLFLRDSYGIPDVKSIAEKKICEILSENKLLGQFPEDLLSLMRQRVKIEKHMLRNRKDETAHHGLIIADSKIRRIAKYYKSTGKLPSDWQYDPVKIRLYVE